MKTSRSPCYKGQCPCRTAVNVKRTTICAEQQHAEKWPRLCSDLHDLECLHSSMQVHCPLSAMLGTVFGAGLLQTEPGGATCRAVIVLADRSKAAMDKEVEERLRGWGIKVWTRQGAPHFARDLANVSAGQAKTVIVLHPDDDLVSS